MGWTVGRGNQELSGVEYKKLKMHMVNYRETTKKNNNNNNKELQLRS